MARIRLAAVAGSHAGLVASTISCYCRKATSLAHHAGAAEKAISLANHADGQIDLPLIAVKHAAENRLEDDDAVF